MNSQAVVTASRNPSQLFHSTTSIAMMPAMAAMAIPTGPVINVRAPAKAVAAALPVVAAPVNRAKPPVMAGMMVVSVVMAPKMPWPLPGFQPVSCPSQAFNHLRKLTLLILY